MKLAGAGYRTRVILQLLRDGDRRWIGKLALQSAERDRLVRTAGHDVLGEVGCCFSRDACCGALSHQALRAVAAYLPVFVEEDALRHERIRAAFLYQCDFWPHCRSLCRLTAGRLDCLKRGYISDLLRVGDLVIADVKVWPCRCQNRAAFFLVIGSCAQSTLASIASRGHDPDLQPAIDIAQPISHTAWSKFDKWGTCASRAHALQRWLR